MSAFHAEASEKTTVFVEKNVIEQPGSGQVGPQGGLRMFKKKQVIGGPVEIGGRVLSLSRAIRAGDFVYLTGQIPMRDGAMSFPLSLLSPNPEKSLPGALP